MSAHVLTIKLLLSTDEELAPSCLKSELAQSRRNLTQVRASWWLNETEAERKLKLALTFIDLYLCLSGFCVINLSFSTLS